MLGFLYGVQNVESVTVEWRGGLVLVLLQHAERVPVI